MLKKIGDYILCILPFLMMMAIQFSVGFFYMVIYEIMQGGMPKELIVMNAAAHLSTAGIALLWYYAEFGRNGAKRREKIFSAKMLAGSVAFAVALQALIQCFFMLLDVFAPSWIEAYSAMIEESGIGDRTVVSTLATLVLAPIGEELAFRGLTYRYARRAGAGFWTANIIQAVLFGVMHMQPLQSIYAAVLGLVLGYLMESYQSVYVPVLMHCLFNFVGTYGVSLFGDLETTWLLCGVFFAAGTVLSVAGVLSVKADKKDRKRKRKRKREEMANG